MRSALFAVSARVGCVFPQARQCMSRHNHVLPLPSCVCLQRVCSTRGSLLGARVASTQKPCARSVASESGCLVHLTPSLSPRDEGFLHPMPPNANDAADSNSSETWCTLGIRDTQSEIDAGHVTLESVLLAHRLRADKLKESYGFFHDIHLEPIVRNFSDGKRTLPGHGVVATVKDLQLYQFGKPDRRGSELRKDDLALRSHPAVSRLEEQGVAIVAQTSCSEFGTTPSSNNRLVGCVRNPFQPYLTTGGSSGGSAGAVAAKVGHFSLGNDRAGSLRIPASFCGCVAVQPQNSLGIQGGTSLFGNNNTSLGPIARSVQDAAIALDLLASFDSDSVALEAACADGAAVAAGAPRKAESLRVATLAATKWYTPDARVGEAFAQAVRRVQAVSRNGGVSVHELNPVADEPYYPEDDPAPHIRDWWAYDTFHMMSDVMEALKRRPHSNADRVSAHVRDVMSAGSCVTDARAQEASAFLKATTLSGFFARSGFDALLTPTVGVLPWDVDLLTPLASSGETFTTDWNAFTYPVNFANVASGTLNCGWHRVVSHGREYVVPIGMQVLVADSGVPYKNVRNLLYLMGYLERAFAHVNAEHGFPRFRALVL
jgi:aspartyl-tRNA(Asn)/glutamyl-tRNA(Gln) amidotransferase subunit A